MAQIPKEDVIQAVVVTDCFEDLFLPVTGDIPLVSMLPKNLIQVKCLFSALLLLIFHLFA